MYDCRLLRCIALHCIASHCIALYCVQRTGTLTFCSLQLFHSAPQSVHVVNCLHANLFALIIIYLSVCLSVYLLPLRLIDMIVGHRECLTEILKLCHNMGTAQDSAIDTTHIFTHENT